MIRQTYSTVSSAFELPRIIQLANNLFAASFFLMKLLPARFILDQAREAGKIRTGSIIIETTSGTFGLALATLCAERGYNLILVSDPAVDEQLKRRLQDLGARVEIVDQPAVTGGFQRARLDRMAQLQAQYPDHYWPSQYSNPHNPGAYAPLVEVLVEAVGRIDCLIGSVGSGGSMCGTSNYLRTLFPHLYAVGIDTLGSVLFGQPDAKRMLRGLGNSLLPKNLDHRLFDEVHWVNAAEAFLATRVMHRKHALFMGGTSGATYLVARWWAEQNPGARVVCLFPDEGYRYIDTIYNDEWLNSNGVLLKQLPAEPKLLKHPAEAGPEWSRILWNRRTYDQVLSCQANEGGVA
jgi:cysteine synthase